MYVYGYSHKNKFYLTKREIRDIVIAWLVISFAFSWRGLNFSAMLKILPIILIGTLTGFIFHELAHKFTAIHYGADAEFYMWKSGLIFATVLALITNGSFVFAAPGAVYIFGPHINRRQNGIISLAGPLANAIVAIVFIALAFLIKNTLFLQIAINVAYINLFLGLFNLLPIPPLDGSKIITWNIFAWAGLGVIMLVLFIFI